MCKNVDNILNRFFELLQSQEEALASPNHSAKTSISEVSNSTTTTYPPTTITPPPPPIPPSFMIKYNNKKKQSLSIQSRDHESVELVKEDFERLANEYIRPYFYDGYQAKGAYICIQSPNESTQAIIDFWNMIWDHCVFTIVLVDRYIRFRYAYWPSKVGQMLKLQNGFVIQNTSIEEFDNFKITYLHVLNSFSGGHVRYL
jgi:protein tyrosine phosphatase